MAEVVDAPDLKSVGSIPVGVQVPLVLLGVLNQFLNKQKYGTGMKYRIDTRYVWYNKESMLVLMYFINQVPFTFDEVPESLYYDKEILAIADNEKRFEPEELYYSSFYLIDELCHPLMFDVELENPELLPAD